MNKTTKNSQKLTETYKIKTFLGQMFRSPNCIINWMQTINWQKYLVRLTGWRVEPAWSLGCFLQQVPFAYHFIRNANVWYGDLVTGEEGKWSFLTTHGHDEPFAHIVKGWAWNSSQEGSKGYRVSHCEKLERPEPTCSRANLSMPSTPIYRTQPLRGQVVSAYSQVIHAADICRLRVHNIVIPSRILIRHGPSLPTYLTRA